jgi:2',3'-cyclic-nucleotide 2'-phosphodiesterase/3'-nucleotidase
MSRAAGALRCLLVATMLVALAPAPPAALRRAGPVTLLATTDFHGALVSGGTDRRSGRPWGGAVALGQLVRAERERRPDRTFLLDAGDQMQGTPESNFTSGRAAVAALNAFGVDAAAVGNHEFDWGIDTLRARLGDMKYPLLAANVFERKTGRRPEWLRATALVERDGVRIGVIGYVTPETPRVTMPLNVESLRFDAPEESVAQQARDLRRRGADVVVVVCHLGGEQQGSGPIAGEVATLARAARGHVDAIVGGHTHTFVAGRVDGVPVVVAASNGRALGRIVLDWDGRRVRGAEVDLLRAYSDSLQVPSWDPIAALVDSMRALVHPFTSRVLGRAERPLGRDALANLVTDSMRDALQADVALTNPGGIRRDFPAGPITAGQVFELLPFENALVEVRLSGAQLRRVIASRPDKCRLSGLKGRWQPDAPPPDQLVLQRPDGTPLADDSTYVVVTNSFLTTGGDGFQGWDAGAMRVTTTTIRDALTAAIEAATAAGRGIDPDPAPRFVLPNGD